VRLLFDQNLARRLVRTLSAEYPDSVHVADVGLDTAADRAIWNYAGVHGYAIVSKDTDFRQLAFLYGPPPKVIWMRVGNVPTYAIEDLLRASVAAITRFAESDEESFLVLSRDE
jgi:predicted nuclease of predicted toxin-antitoxin system